MECEETLIWPEGNKPRVLIAGGGISGLYCALKLKERGFRVILLEASKAEKPWGGRIETEQLDGFTAEFGPMRFKLKTQPRFKKLLHDLGVATETFVPHSAAEIEYPKYDLEGDEKGLNSLQMLRRGVLLIMGKNLTGDPYGNKHQQWINDLTEDDYQDIRKNQKLHGQYLWNTGFWNALSATGGLSHQALMMIRDSGTFYHMIPDNLNGIEWTIWWLRAFKTGDLSGLKGGSSILISKLREKLNKLRVPMSSDSKVISFHHSPHGGGDIQVRLDRNRGIRADHLILAMPKAPLVQLGGSLPKRVRDNLNSVNGFPMIKVFFVVRRAWWECKPKPHCRANRMPTREVHYTRRPNCDKPDDDGHGMIMIYTDRPATEYWKHYVAGETHERAEIDGDPQLKAQAARWLAKEVCEAARSKSGTLELTDEGSARFKDMNPEECAAEIERDMITYAIRDWARPPFGAANHSWEPGVKSWEVQEQFKAFRLEGGSLDNIHICGEAYSDYSGFIEGALNTAVLAMETIT